jgi:endonuclease/exonuclease/phosphatase family metal-dependent hydrolase
MRIMRKNNFLGIMILTLLLLFSGATYGQEIAAVQDDARASAHGAVSLLVLTWNVEGGKCDAPRAEVLTVVSGHLARLKREDGLDVVALQEVFQYQADGIAAALNFRNVHFYPTITCDDGKLRGNAILSRYRFEVGSKRQHPFEIQHPEEKEKRNVIGGSIQVEGRRVYLFSTHLTSTEENPKTRGPSKKRFCDSAEDSCEANFWRAQQAVESVDFAEGYRPARAEPFRAILMGDFNAERNPTITDRDRNAYRQVTGRFRDAWVISSQNMGWEIGDRRGFTIPTGPVNRPDPAYKRVDYVFLRKNSGINVVSAARLRRTGDASDHYPVRAILSFN